jgi:RNA polymerase sigma-70 factor (ECF subfamily)
MPPLRAWFRGKDRLEGFLRLGPLSGEWRWRHRATTVNGQAAIGSYAWLESEGAYLPFALDVLRVDADGHISEVVSFINRVGEGHEPAAFARWPELEQHAERTAVFVRTGLPERLPA